MRDHEPRQALVGGEEGTELVFRLIDQAPPRLAPEGLLALEVGWQQARRVGARLEDRGYRETSIREDFAGIERIVVARRPG